MASLIALLLLLLLWLLLSSGLAVACRILTEKGMLIHWIQQSRKRKAIMNLLFLRNKGKKTISERVPLVKNK